MSNNTKGENDLEICEVVEKWSTLLLVFLIIGGSSRCKLAVVGDDCSFCILHIVVFFCFLLFWCDTAIDDGDCQANEKKKCKFSGEY